MAKDILDAVMFALKRSGGSADVDAICAQTGLARRVVEMRLWLLASKDRVIDDGGIWRTQDPLAGREQAPLEHSA